MKRLVLMAVGAGLLCLTTSPAMAAKADGKKAKLIAKYDKNGNGIIDGEEKDAIRKDYEADPKGDLKAYDTDHDGKLSDEEIAAIKPGSGAVKSATKAKGKKKAGNSAAAASSENSGGSTNSANADSSEKKEK